MANLFKVSKVRSPAGVRMKTQISDKWRSPASWITSAPTGVGGNYAVHGSLYHHSPERDGAALGSVAKVPITFPVTGNVYSPRWRVGGNVRVSGGGTYTASGPYLERSASDAGIGSSRCRRSR